LLFVQTNTITNERKGNMGLTIHYSLKAQGSDARARELVKALHQAAQDLPFQELGQVVELSGEQCDYNRRDREDPLRWLLIQAEAKVETKQAAGSELCRQLHRLRPLHLIAFSAWPGEGCEESNFGLCQYPAGIEMKTGRLKTGLSGWSFRSFCKTQYASDPGCGGVPNFLQCHLSVIALLDKARELGCLGKVDDEGGFWDARDLQALVQQVGSWNEMLAALAGKLKDGASDRPYAIEAPITDFPNFEQLEAAGQNRLPPEFEKLAKLVDRVSRVHRRPGT
jgi:hypothetical protein